MALASPVQKDCLVSAERSLRQTWEVTKFHKADEVKKVQKVLGGLQMDTIFGQPYTAFACWQNHMDIEKRAKRTSFHKLVFVSSVIKCARTHGLLRALAPLFSPSRIQHRLTLPCICAASQGSHWISCCSTQAITTQGSLINLRIGIIVVLTAGCFIRCPPLDGFCQLLTTICLCHHYICGSFQWGWYVPKKRNTHGETYPYGWAIEQGWLSRLYMLLAWCWSWL